jgi:hypothetical protein
MLPFLSLSPSILFSFNFKTCSENPFWNSFYNVLGSMKSIKFLVSTHHIGDCILLIHLGSPDVNKKTIWVLGKHHLPSLSLYFHLVNYFFV